MSAPAAGAFRSLRSHNYRVWAAGGFVSNIGTWVQRTAQDWLVLTILTHHSASAVGIVMALQFGPQFLFLPWTGFAADHFNQRRLMMATQSAMALLALLLGLLTVTGVVQLWHVYVFAFLFGTAAAFDAPVRQTFIAELVGDGDLANAVALNSTSFNAARLIGPAISGLIIAMVGTGWSFLLNGASFVAVLLSLALLRTGELHPHPRAIRTKGSFTEGFRYVWGRPDLQTILIMLFVVGTFGLNFPIFISTMAVRIFHADARGYGLLSSAMAIGTVSGALFNARRDRPRFESLLGAACLFGIGCTLAALAPEYWSFAAALVIIGVAALIFTNSTNSLMQLSTEPAMRGRVMALRVSVALGGAPIGAPIVGWVADHLGPRWALGVGAASGFAAAAVAVYALTKGVGRHRTPARQT
ncbi:MFS transporter [Sphingomonas abietis]|uniref:MFS transporter n=1 Tax=Sphingomonas abietis TaxID=3012344 RepID=A0ABY7NK36_9SPHN|nr:MFS transporter [Sphingomonas abietis]WBO20881.1 MFS transporter [Sphingomonas abietis]